MKHWYALYTKPRREHFVCAHLQKRGIEPFLPLVKVMKKGRVLESNDPLFPNYLFVHCDLSEVGRSTLEWTQGVRRVVGFIGEPAIVEDEVISYIKKRLSVDIQPVGSRRFEPGDTVIIKNGPFRDLGAVFDGNLSAKGRVRVLLSSMHRTISCEVDESWLDKLA